MFRRAAMSLESLHPEAELLLLCARTSVNDETANRIRILLEADLDWEYLLRTAVQHGILPLIYHSLSTTCPDAVPKATLEELRDYFYANECHNLLLTRELLNLLNLFETNSIAAVAYKGPVLAALAYNNLSLRQFSDLDILIREQDVLRAKDLLISQGYQLQAQFADSGVTARLLSEKKDFRFVRDEDKVKVELHWRITEHTFFSPLDTNHFWGRLERISFVGTTILSFSPDDLLLILCVHGSGHRWRRLEWICDVAELIRANQDFDWEQIMEWATILGSKRMLLLGILQVSHLLGARLPEEVLQKAQNDAAARILAAQAHLRLFEEPIGPDLYIRDHIFDLLLRERLPERMRYCLEVVRLRMRPTSRDRAFVALPAAMSFVYYLFRPVRLARDYGLNSLKSLLKRQRK